MKNLQCGLIKALKKSGRKFIRLRMPNAQEAKRRYLEMYRRHLQFPESFTKSHDAGYILKAYEIMSDEEILASEKRDYELRGEQLGKFLKNYRQFKKESGKTRVLAR